MDDRLNYPELLLDLEIQLNEVLGKNGIEKALAASVSRECVEHVRHSWGGSFLYIPKGTMFELSERNQEIWKRFNGHNHAELAEEYGFSVVHIYRLMEFMRRVEQQRRQLSLFPEVQAG